ncbi:rod shape-determining protein MreD [Melghirimyces algeriensis]|uniref:Rod shape-determining protein MreD n=1 Tax=Melghirimyces algeriensis TaxID=910412 RepID=A0A521ARX5_9BACL|nr:rod shape-determining protein MreD [Melghirimyces algeriensis]SMO37593.1 rod shape-determining protein MreD [Melghirimyces algeriensis]
MPVSWMFIGFLSFFFLLEGTVLQFVAPQAWGSSIVWIPQLVTSGIIIYSLYQGRKPGLIYGFCFGLIYDVVHGQAIGVYAFSTALVGYFSGLISRQLFSGSTVALLTTAICQAVHLFMSYGWFRLFNITEVPWKEAAVYHIVPSVLINMVLAYPIYRLVLWMIKRTGSRSIQLFE